MVFQRGARLQELQGVFRIRELDDGEIIGEHPPAIVKVEGIRHPCEPVVFFVIGTVIPGLDILKDIAMIRLLQGMFESKPGQEESNDGRIRHH